MSTTRGVVVSTASPVTGSSYIVPSAPRSCITRPEARSWLTVPMASDPEAAGVAPEVENDPSRVRGRHGLQDRGQVIGDTLGEHRDPDQRHGPVRDHRPLDDGEPHLLALDREAEALGRARTVHGHRHHVAAARAQRARQLGARQPPCCTTVDRENLITETEAGPFCRPAGDDRPDHGHVARDLELGADCHRRGVEVRVLRRHLVGCEERRVVPCRPPPTPSHRPRRMPARSSRGPTRGRSARGAGPRHHG